MLSVHEIHETKRKSSRRGVRQASLCTDAEYNIARAGRAMRGLVTCIAGFGTSTSLEWAWAFLSSYDTS